MSLFKSGPTIFFGRISALLPTLIILNLFFGWFLFGFFNWLLIGITLVFIFLITISVFAKSFKINLSGQRPNDEDTIDIQGRTLDDEELTGPNYQDKVTCPHCNSDETRFVAPHYEMSEYECLKCGLRFEVEE